MVINIPTPGKFPGVGILITIVDVEGMQLRIDVVDSNVPLLLGLDQLDANQLQVLSVSNELLIHWTWRNLGSGSHPIGSSRARAVESSLHRFNRQVGDLRGIHQWGNTGMVVPSQCFRTDESYPGGKTFLR